MDMILIACIAVIAILGALRAGFVLGQSSPQAETSFKAFIDYLMQESGSAREKFLTLLIKRLSWKDRWFAYKAIIKLQLDDHDTASGTKGQGSTPAADIGQERIVLPDDGL